MTIEGIWHDTLSSAPMIYDCFLINREFDLLEMRLHELAPVVDRFVLVEATHTFFGQPKPLHYQENRACFQARNSTRALPAKRSPTPLLRPMTRTLVAGRRASAAAIRLPRPRSHRAR
jgi:hypothetical protein